VKYLKQNESPPSLDYEDENYRLGYGSPSTGTSKPAAP
jgi:hypothetical protein